MQVVLIAVFAATCSDGVFPFISWHKYFTGHHPPQLELLVLFFPATGAHTPLALVVACGGASCIFVAVVVVYSYVKVAVEWW